MQSRLTPHLHRKMVLLGAERPNDEYVTTYFDKYNAGVGLPGGRQQFPNTDAAQPATSTSSRNAARLAAARSMLRARFTTSLAAMRSRLTSPRLHRQKLDSFHAGLTFDGLEHPGQSHSTHRMHLYTPDYIHLRQPMHHFLVFTTFLLFRY